MTAGTVAGPLSEAPWERLDPRMLLVHPIRELWKFLPALVGLAVAGASGAGPWALFGILVPVALGVVRYLTTTWRVSGERVELRRGLLHRHTLSTPVDRVRTVDLTASPVHRVLGMATLVIGTGSVASDADERLELDALPRGQATALRMRLLDRLSAPAADDPTWVTGLAPSQVVARFSPRWLWYAPFSGTVLVAIGAVVGVVAQFSELIDLRITEDDIAVIDGVFVTTVAIGGVLVATTLAVGGYLVTNGGFVLSRHGGAWHVRRGLLTRRETSIDVARLAGLRLGEPAALRWAHGRRVSAIVTGLGSGQTSSASLLPPAPAATAYDVSAAVLGTLVPVTGALVEHGRSAVTRRYTRALVGALMVVALLAATVYAGATGWLLAGAVLPLGAAFALATDRARSMGHAHLGGYVVMRSGSLLRARAVLESSHVIGWNLRATWFQRRAGLATVAATTAGGGGSIEVYDVPVPAALALAEAATPGLISQFSKEER